MVSLALLSTVLARSAVAGGDPLGRWSQRFEPATSVTAPLAVFEGKIVAGEHRLKDGHWVRLGGGIPLAQASVESVVVDGSNLYAAGYSRSLSMLRSGFVAKWDGSEWTVLASDLRSRRMVLAVFDGQLHVAGQVEEVGDLGFRTVVARWNGSQWIRLGDGFEADVMALAVFDGELHVAGGVDRRSPFDDGTNIGMLARWDGDTWLQLGSRVNGFIESLYSADDGLYVGGCFTVVGSKATVPALHVARWNGERWSALGEGVGNDIPCGSSGRSGIPSHTVTTMVRYGEDLVVGGSFDEVAGLAAGNLARWDGKRWSRFGAGFNRSVSSLLVSDGDLVATGTYAEIVEGAVSPGVVRWNGTSWGPLTAASSTLALVNVLENDGKEVYAGGYFRTAGGSTAGGVARWNGLTWSAVGGSLEGDVLDLALLGEAVYVSGRIRLGPDGPYDYRVAKWDGVSWQMLADGPGTLVDLEAFQGELYAAGMMDRGSWTVVRWNGQSWKQIGSEIRGQIFGLEAGDKLYISGPLGTIGDVRYADVAAWDGTQWTSLGEHNGYADKLAWSGTHLYGLGLFGYDDSDYKTVARWNGSKWIPFGVSESPSMGWWIEASGEDVFVSAEGALIDGEPHYGLAHWNGAVWQGYDEMRAWALTLLEDNLYVAGLLSDGGGNNRETTGIYAFGACGNGVLDEGEDCDPGIDGVGACCNVNTCRIAGSGAVCRASHGPCDKAETCDGTREACPRDQLRPRGFSCRHAIDGCQGAGTCDGQGLSCSIDPVEPCGDSVFCNGVESCAAGGSCISGVAIQCDDENECTTDTCADGYEACRHTIEARPGCTRCGDLDYDDCVTTSDALAVLRGAVGIQSCPPFPCDFDGSGAVTTSDALTILGVAVGTSMESACPGDDVSAADNCYDDDGPDEEIPGPDGPPASGLR